MNLLAQFVTLNTVRLNLDVVSRKRVFEEAALIYETSYGIPHEHAFEALLEREKIGSTSIGLGCALPHGRAKDIEEPALVIIRTLNPISFDTPNNKKVQIFFSMLFPENDQSDFLKFLKEAEAFLLNNSLRRQLLEASTEISVCELIAQWVPPEELHLALDDYPEEEEEPETPSKDTSEEKFW